MLVSLRLRIFERERRRARIAAAPSVCVMFRPMDAVNRFMKKFLGTLSPIYEIIVPC
ncbi:protein of unknown function [Azospirillum lipoferum 4B]|uniref:Uncharacterized protein n=1 Tax=Azospirillum lipoferum (strain 4B) TaxID=862719 RepID=G7Z3M7_AZOL4|nr:protein of unknown function [Azospirillum lipoferum 4B]